MTRFFGMLLVFALMVSVCSADAWDDSIAKAHGLKKAGDFVGAAEATPRTLCKAIYYWKAACKVVGHLNDRNDWAINDSLTVDQKKEGLRLLGLASDNLKSALTPSNLTAPDDGTCSGVNTDDLERLIAAVTHSIDAAPESE